MTDSPDRLPPAPWMAAPSTLAVIAALQAEGGADAARYVGGCVRDTLLQRPLAIALLDQETPGAEPYLDIDIATPLPPDRVVAALKRARLKAVPTGIAHGTVTAVSGGRPYEITTLRRDVETDGRHAVVAFTDDWAEDAGRRDFRLNALYASPGGRLHDPTGGGVADALAGRVVFVGEPERRIAEDYLRVLRFFRFSAWYGAGPLDAAGLLACAAGAGGVETLSAERVAKELLKLLAAPDPRPSVEAMAQAGVLARLPLQPDVARLAALVTREAVLGLPPDAGLRLAALSRGDPAALARALRLPNALRDRLVQAEGPLDPAVWDGGQPLRAALYTLGRQAVTDRLMLEGGAESPLAPTLAVAATWPIPALPLGGAEIKAAGVTQGPEVGRVRRAVEAWWVAADFPDDPAALGQALKAAATPA